MTGGWLERASDLLREPAPGVTPFAVESLLVDRCIGAIQGTPKVGKTWLVLELAVAIATGLDAFGRFTVPEPGPVIVVLEESGRDALRRRLDKLTRGHAIAPETLSDLHFAANQRVRLNDPDWQQRLIERGRLLRPRAIFLDPLARMKGATVDENAQREMGPILDFMRDLRDATDSAVVFVHHAGHDGTRLRGSSDLEAYWESKLAVTRDEKTGVCTLLAEHREAEAPDPFGYRFATDPVTDTISLTPVMPSPVLPMPPRDLATEIESYLDEHGCATAPEIAKELRKRRETVEAILGSEARFVVASPPPGRSPKAKTYALAASLVPVFGTNRDASLSGHCLLDSSPDPTTPLKGVGSRDESADSSKRPNEQAAQGEGYRKSDRVGDTSESSLNAPATLTRPGAWHQGGTP